MEYLEKIWNAIYLFFSGYGLQIIKALTWLAVGILLILIITQKVKRASVKSRKLDNSASAFLTSIVRLLAYVVLIVIVLATLGFSVEGIIAAFSSVMLAIALGLQNALSSLTNGVLLIFTKPFKAGDFVSIGGTDGTVKEIKLFSVQLTTVDNLTIIIPNSEVLNSKITNYSNISLRRMDIIVPVSYDSDIDKVKAVVMEVVKNDSRIVTSPEPFFRLTEYGASSLDFTLRVWTTLSDFWNVKFDLLENILKALNKNEIEIPFDQLEVYVHPNNGIKKAKINSAEEEA